VDFQDAADNLATTRRRNGWSILLLRENKLERFSDSTTAAMKL
jgi:hypothetical protein